MWISNMLSSAVFRCAHVFEVDLHVLNTAIRNVILYTFTVSRSSFSGSVIATRNQTSKQGSIPVGCVPTTFLVQGRGVCPSPCRQTPLPWMQTWMKKDADPLPPWMQTPIGHVTCDACWEAKPPDAGHVTCDACWEANPLLSCGQNDRQV